MSASKKTKQISRRGKDGSGGGGCPKSIAEDELIQKDNITPEDVCNLPTITKGLCVVCVSKS